MQKFKKATEAHKKYPSQLPQVSGRDLVAGLY